MQSIDPRNPQNSSTGFNPQPDNSTRKPEPSKGLEIAIYISWILIIPALIYVVWYFKTRNDFINKQTRINQQSSGIDIQLAKRRDTLTKTFATVKGYLKHEKEVLTDITKLRTQQITPENRSEIDSKMENISTQFKLAFEAYPDLKANTLMVDFMEEIVDIEREIAAARRLYNSDVQAYNSKILISPANIISSKLNLLTFPLFVASATQRQDVDVSFN